MGPPEMHQRFEGLQDRERCGGKKICKGSRSVKCSEGSSQRDLKSLSTGSLPIDRFRKLPELKKAGKRKNTQRKY